MSENDRSMKINEKLLQRSYDHFESALNLLKDMKIENFVSRFYYGITLFLNSMISKPKGKWHERRRYEQIFRKYKVMEEIWKYFKAMRYAADYGYYDSKNWDRYEDEFWMEGLNYIEKFLDFLESGIKEQYLEIALIRKKVKEIMIWLAVLKNAIQ